MSNPFEVIEARLNNIENLLLDLKHTPKEQRKPTTSDSWLNLIELCDYLPDKPAKPTVYAWVNNGLIPYHKGAKRLRFLKSDIDAWLQQGRRKTTEENKADAINLIKKKGGINE